MKEVFVVFGGIDNFPDYRDDLKTIRLFDTDKGAKVYAEDLKKGTNNSGLNVTPEGCRVRYDCVSIQTLKVNP